MMPKRNLRKEGAGLAEDKHTLPLRGGPHRRWRGRGAAASVVKELLENAVDAGARNVTLELRGGGREYIRVTDDGCGMSPEDAGIAFLRHATSKLSDARGLEAIGTLGFRGEALAAISSVSHIELSSCERGAGLGVRMKLDAGEISDMYETGCPGGHDDDSPGPLLQHARAAEVHEDGQGRGRGLRAGGPALRPGPSGRQLPLH